MSKFWKIATLTFLTLTIISWTTLCINSLTDPFLQSCFSLGEGAYCADYRFTPIGKAFIFCSIILPLLTLGIFIIGKIKHLEATSDTSDNDTPRPASDNT